MSARPGCEEKGRHGDNEGLRLGIGARPVELRRAGDDAVEAADELARRFEDVGVAAVIYTDIDRDGALEGVNAEATAALARALTLPVIASGGVSSLDDLRRLKAYEKDGIIGVISGRAIYDGRLDLAEALAVLR